MEQKHCMACDSNVPPRVETRSETYEVRDENITIDAQVGVCPECGADLPIDDLDEATLSRAFAEYRRRRGLITPDQMRALRARYGLGVRPFSLLLGWGELTMHRYESGSLQDDAHESQLRLAENPANVRLLMGLNGHKLTPRQKGTVEARLSAIEAGESESVCVVLSERIPARESLDEFGGFVPRHLGKLREMMVFFCGLAEVYPTKLNKLLFYADFLHFKNHGVSISGSPYLAFQRGPVPEHYEWIKADLVEAGDLESEWIDWGDGGGERLCPSRDADLSGFGDSEIETIQLVAEALGHKSGKYLQDLSHQEKAYEQTTFRAMIPYGFALDLSL